MNKPTLHNHCTSILEQKLLELNKGMQELRESAAADTKSSMGDKYETAREMAQQELSKLQDQEEKTKHLLLVLKSIDPNKICSKAEAGCLIQTNKMWFYLAAAIGKVQIDQDMVMVISMQSPFGAALIGKKSGEMVSVNGQGYRILQLL